MVRKPGLLLDLDEREEGHRRSRTLDIELQVVALARPGDGPPELVGRGDVPAVDLGDHVSLPNSGVGRRRDLPHVNHQKTRYVVLDPLHLANLRGQLGHGDADSLPRILRARLARVLLLGRSDVALGEGRRQRRVAAVADDPKTDLAARRLARDVADQVAGVLDGDVVHSHDRIARLDARPVRRLARLDRLNESSVERLQPERRRLVAVDVLDVDPEETARDLPFLPQLRKNALQRVDGHRETDVLSRTEHRGVDPDDFAVDVDERAAGVAGVDGSVGLDEILERTGRGDA